MNFAVELEDWTENAEAREGGNVDRDVYGLQPFYPAPAVRRNAILELRSMNSRRSLEALDDLLSRYRRVLALIAYRVLGNHEDAVDFFADVIHFEFDGSGSGRRHAVVSDVLMNGADEMWSLRVFELEAEVSVGVGLGAAAFFHALAKLEQDDIVAGGGFARGGVFYRAGESLGGGEGCEKDDSENNKDARVALIACCAPCTKRRGRSLRSLVRAKSALSRDDKVGDFFQDRIPFCGGRLFSRREISARRVAASSCKFDFREA